MEVYKNDRDTVPVLTFENLSLKLTKSAKQQQVQSASDSTQKGIEAKSDANAIQDRISHMTPEQLQELGKQIPPVK